MKIAKRFLPPMMLALALTACGGGGGTSSPAPTASMAPAVSPAPSQACATTGEANSAFHCALSSPLGAVAVWSLENAPEGMVIQPSSGQLRWTPASNQAGKISFNVLASVGTTQDRQTITVTVAAGAADPVGLYVSRNGSDANAGSAVAPFATLQRAVDLAVPGTTIYLRGGEFRNAEYGMPYATRAESALVRIASSGTAGSPITIRNFGNEYVRLKSDVSGIMFSSNQDTDHWTIKGIEIAGNAQDLGYDIALDEWWKDGVQPTSGRGIGGRMDHILIEDCIVHDFPGAGIAPRRSEYVTIRNNIVFNNGWWTTAGTHGITVSDMKSTASSTEQTVLIEGNLAFNNRSLIISHVFSKGAVSLIIDEGNGIHLQNNTAAFAKEAVVQKNLALFNGKAGLGINTMDRATIRNNAFFMNANVVNRQAEISIQSSTLRTVSDNLFHPRSGGQTIRDFQNVYANVGANATLAGLGFDSDLPAAVQRFDTVFADPSRFDFRPANGVPSTYGVPASVLAALSGRLTEYGISVVEAGLPPGAPSLLDQKKRIFALWPAEWRSIILEDKETGYSWSYAQRCHYPMLPAATDCT